MPFQAGYLDRPPIIKRWIERVRDFSDNPGKILSLAGALFGRKMAADPTGDHKPRKMRSERREDCCDRLGSIAHVESYRVTGFCYRFMVVGTKSYLAS